MIVSIVSCFEVRLKKSDLGHKRSSSEMSHFKAMPQAASSQYR